MKKQLLDLFKLWRARVRWFLSIDKIIYQKMQLQGEKLHRSITIENEELEFSGGLPIYHFKAISVFGRQKL